MSDTRTITADQADEILDAADCDPGETAGDFTYITILESSQRRWMQGITIVVSDPDGNFWGLDYDRGLTEEQDNEYPWRGYGGPRDVDMRRLYAHQVVTTVYKTTPAAVTA